MSPVIEKSNNLIERLITSQILVGLDIGYKTIGIAVSDRSFTIATPLNTVSLGSQLIFFGTSPFF